MTTITPEHDSGICHSAGENRRCLLVQLKQMAEVLERCEMECNEINDEKKNHVNCRSPLPVKTQEPLQCHKALNDERKKQDYCKCSSPVKTQEIPKCPKQFNAEKKKNEDCTRALPVKAQELPKCTKENEAEKRNLNKCQKKDDHHHREPQIIFQNCRNNYGCHPSPADRPLISFPEFPEKPAYKRETPTQACGPELVSGVLIATCDCMKRNGLQDQCRRNQCHELL